LFELTVRDPLTRAYNRRFLLAHLNSELAFAVRQKLSLALLLVDIDHFKRVNDTYGHGVGDVVLQLVAGSIQRMLRPYDVLCRYGGEEFIVVARDTSQRNAEILAERIRRHIESMRFDLVAAPFSLTVSVGVASTHRQGPAPEIDALLAAADEALYDAKHSGRNRVCARHPSTPPGDRRGTAHTLPPAAGNGPDEQQTLPPS
jgi:diguanylate cyclase (GGDEF)-like protein